MSSSSRAGAVKLALQSSADRLLLETDRTGQLQGIPLERGTIRKFLEILEAHTCPALRKGRVHRESDCVDGIALVGGNLRDGRSGLGGRLSLLVPREPDLEVSILSHRE